MGTFYGGVAHTPLSSLVLVCELAGSYDLLVPLMLAEGIAFVVLRRRSLYRAQLPTQRDSPAHQHATLDVLRSTRVGAVMRMVSVSGVPIAAPELSVRSDADLRTAAETMLNNKLREIQVTDADGKVVGLLDEADISRFYLRAADEQQPRAQARHAQPTRAPVAVPLEPACSDLTPHSLADYSFSFLARYSAIMTSRACLGTSAYFWNSIVNSPLPWVAERRSVE